MDPFNVQRTTRERSAHPLLPRTFPPSRRQSPGPSGRKKLKEVRRKSSVWRSKFGISPKPDRAREMAADDAQQEDET